MLCNCENILLKLLLKSFKFKLLNYFKILLKSVKRLLRKLLLVIASKEKA